MFRHDFILVWEEEYILSKQQYGTESGPGAGCSLSPFDEQDCRVDLFRREPLGIFPAGSSSKEYFMDISKLPLCDVPRVDARA